MVLGHALASEAFGDSKTADEGSGIEKLETSGIVIPPPDEVVAAKGKLQELLVKLFGDSRSPFDGSVVVDAQIVEGPKSEDSANRPVSDT